MAELYGAWGRAWVSVWPALVDHLWQSTLFVSLLLLVALLLRRSPARLRYAVFLVASVKFLLPASLVFLAVVRVAPGLSDGFRAVPGTALLRVDLPRLEAALGTVLNCAPAFGSAPGGGGPAAPAPWLAALWLAGTAALGGRWLVRRRRFDRRLRAQRRAAGNEQIELLEQARRRLGIRRPVELALIAGIAEPGVWRVWRPVLVVPEKMPDHLDRAELESIFLHELIHVRRWDNLVANLHMLLCCLFWFHPLVWLLDRRLLAEREEACDERVLELGGQAEAYARGLVKAMRLGLGWRLAGVSSAHASNLRHRVERILRGAPRRGSVAAHRLIFASAMLLFLVFSAGAGSTMRPRETGCRLASAEAPRGGEIFLLQRTPAAHAEPGDRVHLPAAPPPEPAYSSSDCPRSRALKS